MMELDEQCKEAGITVMNEIGLDPVSFLYLGRLLGLNHYLSLS
jgi:saccharopine dehydrogenase-like NADP-dependent oxidoreductase